MDECPYVGVECDVITDVITSVFACFNVRRVFNKMSVWLCVGRSEPYLVWLGPTVPRNTAPPAPASNIGLSCMKKEACILEGNAKDRPHYDVT